MVILVLLLSLNANQKMEKVYTRQEILSMRRGQSLYPPIIVNFLSGRTLIFHDKAGGSVRIAEHVGPEDTLAIWCRIPDATPPPGKDGQWTISGSSGSTYSVSLKDGQWDCNCTGWGFRRKCRHVEEAKNKNIKL